MSTHTEIHQSVREHYAKLAGVPQACCLPEECGCGTPEARDLFPEDITLASLGCGDPVTPARIQAGEIVVDLGSGGGLDCFRAARLVGASGRIIGVDMTPELIATARRNAERLEATNVEFRQGFLEEMPIGEREVDVLISNCVINLAPDKSIVFKEMFRVLRSGGRISIADPVSPAPLSSSLQADAESWAECISGALTVRDYREGLHGAGFTQVSIRPDGQFGNQREAVRQNRPFSAIIRAVKP
ncbi:MAG: methyltransferase domain-containing protein [Chloroflexi bacterium]|nr:methyltransferase domain-containing protein [Chloroflexota bacterium]